MFRRHFTHSKDVYAPVPLTITKYGWKNNFKSAGLKKIKEGYAIPEAIKRSSTFANLEGGLCSDFQRNLGVFLLRRECSLALHLMRNRLHYSLGIDLHSWAWLI